MLFSFWIKELRVNKFKKFNKTIKSSTSINLLVTSSIPPESFVECNSSSYISFIISTFPHPFLSKIIRKEDRFYFVMVLYSHINELMVAWRSYATNEFVIWLCIVLDTYRIKISIILNTFVNESINIHIWNLSCRKMNISRIIIAWWSWWEFIKHSKSIVFNEMFF